MTGRRTMLFNSYVVLPQVCAHAIRRSRYNTLCICSWCVVSRERVMPLEDLDDGWSFEFRSVAISNSTRKLDGEMTATYNPIQLVSSRIDQREQKCNAKLPVTLSSSVPEHNQAIDRHSKGSTVISHWSEWRRSTIWRRGSLVSRLPLFILYPETNLSWKQNVEVTRTLYKGSDILHRCGLTSTSIIFT